MSRFYFGDSSSASNASDSDSESLPYPAPLPRSDFLASDFSPSAYLSSLHNRHQTLEDLRSELRTRSQLLNKELLDLVNSNYQDFLSLGSSLQGGDEKVEEVRVGLLGFRKEVEAVKRKVAERGEEVDRLVDERVEVRRQIALGRQLLDIHIRLSEIEGRLMVTPPKKPIDAEEETFSDSETTSDDDEDESSVEGAFISLSKLRRHVQQYLYIRQCCDFMGPDHPFIAAQEPRMSKVRNTLLLDLSTALKQAKIAGEPGKPRLLKLMGVYRDMDEVSEALKVLKVS